MLSNDFIKAFKDRATIDATYTVDKAHAKPNAAKDDGDIHVAGRAPEIGLMTVAEMMNAKSKPLLVKTLQDAAGQAPLKLTGVWRIWMEHGGGGNQVQTVGTVPPAPVPLTTNPDHVFEIHPLTDIAGESALTTLRPIVGYQAKNAHDAFVRYENLRSQIVPGAATTTIVTTMAGYNYVEFKMELNEEPTHEIVDGRTVMASVLDLDGDLLVRNRRMVFVKDSAPEKKVKTLKAGKILHVLGIPRVDLSLVAWRAEHKTDRPEALNWTLPYEIVVVGSYAQ